MNQAEEKRWVVMRRIRGEEKKVPVTSLMTRRAAQRQADRYNNDVERRYDYVYTIEDQYDLVQKISTLDAGSFGLGTVSESGTLLPQWSVDRGGIQF